MSNRSEQPSQLQISRLEAGSASESFSNLSSIPTQAYGSGQATLSGGTGSNTFWVKSGDTIIPGTGPKARRVVPTHPHLMQAHELRLITWS